MFLSSGFLNCVPPLNLFSYTCVSFASCLPWHLLTFWSNAQISKNLWNILLFALWGAKYQRMWTLFIIVSFLINMPVVLLTKKFLGCANSILFGGFGLLEFGLRLPNLIHWFTTSSKYPSVCPYDCVFRILCKLIRILATKTRIQHIKS